LRPVRESKRVHTIVSAARRECVRHDRLDNGTASVSESDVTFTRDQRPLANARGSVWTRGLRTPRNLKNPEPLPDPQVRYAPIRMLLATTPSGRLEFNTPPVCG
jgi:hypothetical protein